MIKIRRYFILSSLILTLLLPTTVGAVEGNLPGGTAVSLQITSPANGTELLTSETTASLNLTATAAIGRGRAVADTTLIYLLDASGSTEESSGLALSCPDQNPADVDPNDPTPDENEIIDCEISAAIALNEQAIALGTIDEVAMIAFAGDAVAADGTPETLYQPLIAPDSDRNGNGTRDVSEILQSIHVAFLFGHQSGFGAFNQMDIPDIIKTDYADALARAGEVASQASNDNVIILMVSDGVNNAGYHVSSALPLVIPGKNVTIHTFTFPDAVGYGGTCDSDSDGLGSLQSVVDLQNGQNGSSNGRCTLVSDPSDLPDVLPTVLVPTLDKVTVQVNGGAEVALPASDVSMPLPQNGPVDIEIDTAVDLPLGTHEICINMYGTDAGGGGKTTDCIQVTVSSNVADLAISPALDTQLNQTNDSGANEFLFMVENLGPATATDVIVSQQLPANASVTDVMTEQGSCTVTDTAVDCQLGSVAVGQSIYITIHLIPGCDSAAVLEATVTAVEEDPVMENNRATINTQTDQIEHGDAPTAVYADATHCNFSMEWLGLTVDGEAAPQDSDSSDDGFDPMASGYPNQRLRATITTSGLGADRYGTEPDERLYLSVWVDYNQDGDWEDEGEQVIFCDVAPGTRGQCNGRAVHWRSADQDSLTFQIRYRLRNPLADDTWVRARLSYGEPVGPTGFAQFGEVEDFEATLFIR